MGKKKKDTFNEIFIEYKSITKEPKKGISMLIRKDEVGSKMFQLYQKMLADGEKLSKQQEKSYLSRHIPRDFMLLLGETIKLMIEDTIIPLLNPRGEISIIKSNDKELYLKCWGQSELIKFMKVLERMGSPDVVLSKMKKSQVDKENRKIRKQLNNLQIV